MKARIRYGFALEVTRILVTITFRKLIEVVEGRQCDISFDSRSRHTTAAIVFKLFTFNTFDSV